MEKYFKEINIAITACTKEGEILDMNDKSQKTFLAPGETRLIGKNVLDCHPEPARSKLKNMLQEPCTNAYTIEKNGIKKLIYQSPWFEDGQYMGFLEFSLEIPLKMPHFTRH